jgi:hypothetical protein
MVVPQNLVIRAFEADVQLRGWVLLHVHQSGARKRKASGPAQSKARQVSFLNEGLREPNDNAPDQAYEAGGCDSASSLILNSHEFLKRH